MASRETDPKRVQILRDLIADAETEVLHTAGDAMSRQGVVSYLRAKLSETETVELNGD